MSTVSRDWFWRSRLALSPSQALQWQVRGEIRARPPLPRVRLALAPPARVRTGHLGKAIQQSCPRDNDTIRIVC